jgi:hypothetical protein
MAGNDPAMHETVLRSVMSYLQNLSSFSHTPPEISRHVHAIIRRETGTADPYAAAKKESNERARKLVSGLREEVLAAEDPLLAAVTCAIIGNVIDFGTEMRFEITDMLQRIHATDVDGEAYRHFKNCLDGAETILYLADNSGEMWFDTVLLEQLQPKCQHLTYVVKAHPIINDVTLNDARTAGVTAFADVMAGDAGQDASAPGLVLSLASDEFMRRFIEADLVIAKGQGNYEALSESSRTVFFLLMVKCPLVAADIGRPVGSMVLTVNP